MELLMGLLGLGLMGLTWLTELRGTPGLIAFAVSFVVWGGASIVKWMD